MQLIKHIFLSRGFCTPPAKTNTPRTFHMRTRQAAKFCERVDVLLKAINTKCQPRTRENACEELVKLAGSESRVKLSENRLLITSLANTAVEESASRSLIAIGCLRVILQLCRDHRCAAIIFNTPGVVSSLLTLLNSAKTSEILQVTVATTLRFVCQSNGQSVFGVVDIMLKMIMSAPRDLTFLQAFRDLADHPEISRRMLGRPEILECILDLIDFREDQISMSLLSMLMDMAAVPVNTQIMLCHDRLMSILTSFLSRFWCDLRDDATHVLLVLADDDNHSWRLLEHEGILDCFIDSIIGDDSPHMLDRVFEVLARVSASPIAGAKIVAHSEMFDLLLKVVENDENHPVNNAIMFDAYINAYDAFLNLSCHWFPIFGEKRVVDLAISRIESEVVSGFDVLANISALDTAADQILNNHRLMDSFVPILRNSDLNDDRLTHVCDALMNIAHTPELCRRLAKRSDIVSLLTLRAVDSPEGESAHWAQAFCLANLAEHAGIPTDNISISITNAYDIRIALDHSLFREQPRIPISFHPVHMFFSVSNFLKHFGSRLPIFDIIEFANTLIGNVESSRLQPGARPYALAALETCDELLAKNKEASGINQLRQSISAIRGTQTEKDEPCPKRRRLE
jgi:hypothetical protein